MVVAPEEIDIVALIAVLVQRGDQLIGVRGGSASKAAPASPAAAAAAEGVRREVGENEDRLFAIRGGQAAEISVEDAEIVRIKLIFAAGPVLRAKGIDDVVRRVASLADADHCIARIAVIGIVIAVIMLVVAGGENRAVHMSVAVHNVHNRLGVVPEIGLARGRAAVVAAETHRINILAGLGIDVIDPRVQAVGRRVVAAVMHVRRERQIGRHVG